MTFHWAAKFDPADAKQIGLLRDLENVQVGILPDFIWVMGTSQSSAPSKGLRPGNSSNSIDEVDRLLRSLRCERFQVTDDTLLVLSGKQVPTAELPDDSKIDWRPLGDWLSVTLPASRVAQGSVSRTPIRLVRSVDIVESNAMLASIGAFEKFADSAPQHRLHVLQFAMNEKGAVFIRGTPLPSIPGQQFVEHSNIARPAGYEWSPSVSASTIRDAFDVSLDSLLILHIDGTWESIDQSEWVKARRSAIRESKQLDSES
jgi:hypothetical protein